MYSLSHIHRHCANIKSCKKSIFTREMASDNK